MSFAADQIELRTFIAPPYQVKIDQVLTGEAVESVKCVLQKINKKHHIKLMPWNRAIKEVENNVAHAYFAVANDPGINLFATLSAPLILEKWFWYYKKNISIHKQRDNFKNALVGVLSDSNEAVWLERRDYTIYSKARTPELLMKLLDKGRVDVILLNKNTFIKEITRLKKLNPYIAQFNKFTPLGVYFSNIFLKQRPAFLREFNQAVYPCTSQHIKLTSQEQLILRQLANTRLKAVAHYPLVISKINEQNGNNRAVAMKQLLALDKQWVQEFHKIEQPLIQTVLTNKLSAYLKQVKKESNGLFAEIFVMDSKGVNVGQSDITSDYWQGDENKYKNTVPVGKGAIFIDEILYDESSQHFQSQISLSITDPQTNEVVGAITFGVDVEKALQQY